LPRIASFELLELLKEGGALVQYCDPYFPEAPRTRNTTWA